MTSGDPKELKGVRREVLDSAREAARRSGMSVDEWLDTVIAESAKNAGIEPPRRPEFGDRTPRDESIGSRTWRRQDADFADHQRQEWSFSDVSTRLDALARQLDHLTYGNVVRVQPPARDPSAGHDDTRLITDALSRIDRKIDRLVDDDRIGSTGAALAEPAIIASAPSIADPDGTVDQALAEIEARRRVLDGGASAAPVDLPRAPTQGLTNLEQQLRQINARIDTMRPCGLDGAVETLRDDLAEIGMMLKDAMPRQAIESLESEIQALASRIDGERHIADGMTIAGLERGLTEVRDAVHALTPAESLVGFDQAVQGLSQKIDRIAGAGPDPEALQQLEGAIGALRGVVSHVASNDTLTQLSDDVQALSEKVDQVTGSDAFSAMEQRIAAIADALQQSHGAPVPDAAGLETVVKSIADKVDQLHSSRSDHSATGHLEERITRLIEKLDASDARFDHLAAIEQGLADLLAQMESQRTPAGRGAIESVETDALKRDVRRTQDSLETVHGTLGHVVDRLATIEAGVRDNPSSRTAPSPDRAPSALSSEPALPFPDIQSSPPVAPLVPSRTPLATDSPPAARANRSPASERRPIDPSLPPDHPLEPGAGRTRGNSAADRIAASEAALENVRPPVIPDPAGKSNFIAAARRAAQAAMVEAPLPKDKRSAEPAGGTAGKPASGKLGGLHKLVVGIGVILLLLGALHVAATRLWFNATPAGEPITTQATHDETPSDAEPPRVVAPAAPDRQSTALPPGMLISPNAPGFGLGAPGGPGSNREMTGSIQQPPFQTTAALPSPSTPLPPAAPARAAGSDHLPPGIGSALRTAAANGDPAAMFEIASRYAEGRGVPRNLAEAASWFERAADKGLAPAQFRLGGLYEKGMGVQKNRDTARRFYVAAAEAGHAKAMHNLAVLYAEGIDGKPDYASAAGWFRKAAEHGVLDSQYNLGILYARGIGVETNLAQAFKWFALASRQGDRDAAKKRNELAARLDKPSLTAAMADAQSWKAQPQPEAAITVKAPPGGWDNVPSTAARNVGQKVETPPRRPAQ